MKRLRCTNKDCHSHKEDDHSFNGLISFYDDGTVADGCEGFDFRCNHCDEYAEWEEIKEDK